MIALGFGVIWVGYAAGFYGYSLIKGYNLSFREVVFPTQFYTGQWPPGLVSDPTVLIPTGSNTGGGSTAGQGTPTVGSSSAAKGVIGRSVTGTTTGSRL